MHQVLIFLGGSLALFSTVTPGLALPNDVGGSSRKSTPSTKRDNVQPANIPEGTLTCRSKHKYGDKAYYFSREEEGLKVIQLGCLSLASGEALKSNVSGFGIGSIQIEASRTDDGDNCPSYLNTNQDLDVKNGTYERTVDDRAAFQQECQESMKIALDNCDTHNDGNSPFWKQGGIFERNCAAWSLAKAPRNEWAPGWSSGSAEDQQLAAQQRDLTIDRDAEPSDWADEAAEPEFPVMRRGANASMVFAPRDTDGGSLTCQKPHEGAKGALTYFSRETGVLMQSACESLADADISPGNPNVTGSYRTVNNTLGSNNYTESVWLDVSGHDPGDGGDCPSYVNFKPKSEDDKRPTDEAAALIKDCKEMLMIVLDECDRVNLHDTFQWKQGGMFERGCVSWSMAKLRRYEWVPGLSGWDWVDVDGLTVVPVLEK